MTMPPPPPDRLHLQYQPAPPPQPQQMGPAGAYGPAPSSPAQPLPGQTPVLSMAKPGTITGIQVVLWIFLAVGAIGDLLSAINLVNYFNPFSLVGLAFALYSTIQALASGVHITRGKRWAWIWSLVSAILGLVLTTAMNIWGIIFWDTGGAVTLLVGVPLAGLYGTLLGLLCSKSARQWILMHRIRRGEAAMPGVTMGAVPGGAPVGGIGQDAPQRPATRPGAATFLVVALCLIMALNVWVIVDAARAYAMMRGSGIRMESPVALFGTRLPMLGAMASVPILVCALISAIGIHRGKFGVRVFTLVWIPILVIPAGWVAISMIVETINYFDVMFPPARTQWILMLVRDVGLVVLINFAFVLALVPGVRKWTPGKPTAIVMMLPNGQQQAGPYGQQPQGGYPQQQQYPPQY